MCERVRGGGQVNRLFGYGPGVCVCVRVKVRGEGGGGLSHKTASTNWQQIRLLGRGKQRGW